MFENKPSTKHANEEIVPKATELGISIDELINMPEEDDGTVAITDTVSDDSDDHDYEEGDGIFQEELDITGGESHRSQEARTPEEFLDRIREYLPYDPKVIEELMAEGFSELEAIAIAATTMDGAGEQAGGVSSRQTNCAYLRYAESTGQSLGQLEGKDAAASRILKEIFGLPGDLQLSNTALDWLSNAALAADSYRAAKNNEGVVAKISLAELVVKQADLQPDIALAERVVADLEQANVDFEDILEVMTMHKQLVQESEHEALLLKMRDKQATYLDVANRVRDVLLLDYSDNQAKIRSIEEKQRLEAERLAQEKKSTNGEEHA